MWREASSRSGCVSKPLFHFPPPPFPFLVCLQIGCRDLHQSCPETSFPVWVSEGLGSCTPPCTFLWQSPCDMWYSADMETPANLLRTVFPRNATLGWAC